MNFAECLKSVRIKLYLSQRAFSEKTGIPLSTLKQWESGDYLPSFSNFKKLLQYLDRDPAERFEIQLAYEREKRRK